jgi:hypothetical protein
MSPEPATASDSFYSGALARISRIMVVVAIAASVSAWVLYGWRIALGFVFGCAIAYLNFHWLKRVVTALTDRITQAGRPQSGKGIVARFLLRYFLIGLAAYVIFSLCPASLYGLFAGLFLPVGAIACEAVYEVYVAVARGL